MYNKSHSIRSIVLEEETIFFFNQIFLSRKYSWQLAQRASKASQLYKQSDVLLCRDVIVSVLDIKYKEKENTRTKERNHNGKVVSYRVVAVVAGNSEAVTLSGLRADTQYQLVVTAVRAGKKFRSRPIVFRTLGKFSLF